MRPRVPSRALRFVIDDFQTGSVGDTVEVDLCVVGAGAAGISIAREFADAKLNVCLVESGAFEYDVATQSLYAGENVGLPYYALDICRLRYFGGTTNHWSGQCAKLSALDFVRRSWVPHSGWPFSKSELDPYYERAQFVCGLGAGVDDDGLFETFEMERPDLNRELLRSFFFRYSPPIRFGRAYRTEIERAKNVQALLNATVTNIVTNDSTSQVEQVEITSLSGRKGNIKARAFVLACGAIENARLLLLPTSSKPNGVGNDHDLVGRYFMEHPEIFTGLVASHNSVQLLKNYRRHWSDEYQYWPAFTTSAVAQRKDRVLGSTAVLDYVGRADSGTTAAIEIGRAVKNREMPDALHRKMWRMLKDLDEVVPNAYRYVMDGEEPITEPERIYFKTLSEQAPNPDSRVTLGRDLDALGMPRAKLDWRLTELDKRSVAVMMHAIGLEFGRLGLGRVKQDAWLSDGTSSWQAEGTDHLRGAFHHMGTTRMADRPEEGVVDARCQVHGMQNLYLAGSSVFPTSGAVNPTFTLVALALRLADHLKFKLR